MIIFEKDLSVKIGLLLNAAMDINKYEMRDPESFLNMIAQKQESQERQALFSTLISKSANKQIPFHEDSAKLCNLTAVEKSTGTYGIVTSSYELMVMVTEFQKKILSWSY